MNLALGIIISILIGLFIAYLISFYILSRRIKESEERVVAIFMEKISKIPAIIEVMRPYVSDTKRVFKSIIRLHSDAIIHEYGSIAMLMEQNARINDQYSFLMKLSMAIPELQKEIYFIYIRDFVITYDRMMRAELISFNLLTKTWNMFIFIKKCTLIGLLFPGR